MNTAVDISPASRFRSEYAAHRAAEGRAYARCELLRLPYVRTGPLARQWSVRARTFDAFVSRILLPAVRRRGAQPVRLLDLGAGNGWLCWRAALAGVQAVAVDWRDDTIDGLGAAAPYVEATPGRFSRVAASFDALPFARGHFDVVVFNASLHYAADLAVVLGEARRAVAADGCIAVLDSPFYARERDGAAMVAEKHAQGAASFGDRAGALLSMDFVEFLTRDRLAEASRALGLVWQRHFVRYPLWYELRPIAARLRRRRVPSRFDLWEGTLA